MSDSAPAPAKALVKVSGYHPWNCGIYAKKAPAAAPTLPPMRGLARELYVPALHGGGAPPAREGALEFARYPSLRNGRRMWWRCPPPDGQAPDNPSPPSNPSHKAHERSAP